METDVMVPRCRDESRLFRFGEESLESLDVLIELQAIHPLALVEYVACRAGKFDGAQIPRKKRNRDHRFGRD